MNWSWRIKFLYLRYQRVSNKWFEVKDKDLKDILCSSKPNRSRRTFTLRPPILILKASGSPMSPDSPSTEMNEITTRIVTKLPLELNNNLPEMGRTQIHSIDSNSNLKIPDEIFDCGDEGRMPEESLRDIFPGPQGDRKVFQSSGSSVSSDTDSTESLDTILIRNKPDEEIRRLSAGGAPNLEKVC